VKTDNNEQFQNNMTLLAVIVQSLLSTARCPFCPCLMFTQIWKVVVQLQWQDGAK